MRRGDLSWLGGIYGAASMLALAAPALAAAIGDIGAGMLSKAGAPDRADIGARERRQAAIAELERRSFELSSLSVFMEEAAALVARTLDVEFLEVLELLPGGRELLLKAGVGWKDGLVGRATVDGGEGSQAGYSLHMGEPVVVEDLALDNRFRATTLLVDHGVVSGVSVTIRGAGKPYGMLGVYTTYPRLFTQDDVYFLRTVANLLGAGIQRWKVGEILREREEGYRSLYMAVSGGIVVQNEDGAVIDANEAASEILGLSLPEIQGRTSFDPPWQAVREDGSPFPAEEHPSMVALRTGQAIRDVAMGVLNARTGERHWILVNAQPIMDQVAGRARAVVTTFLDITEHKRAAEAERFLTEAGSVLASTLEYETTLASAARLAVPRIADWCSVDMLAEDGSLHRLAVAHVDQDRVEVGDRLSRCCRCDLDGGNGLAIALRTGHSRVYPEIADAMLSCSEGDREQVESLRKAGVKSLMVVPLVARGRILGAIQFVSAGSDRRYGGADLELAEGLARLTALAVDNARLYQEAQRAIRVRDDFLSVAAHELRTPLTSLQGFAQLAMKQLHRDGLADLDRMHQALRVIDYQSKKLSGLVSKLLDLSRMDAGGLSVERRLANLTQLVRRVVEGAEFVTNGHTLRLKAPARLEAMVDPRRMEQVVANLVDNAIKYSPGGGLVEIELSAPTLDMVRLTVRDHGIGIPPERRDKIFRRHYRAHSIKHFSGLGLGLYIAREIVALHGGHLQVECPPDGGSLFTVTLPRCMGALSLEEDRPA